MSPVLLNPTLYGLLAVCVGLSGLIIYLLDGTVNRTFFLFGTVVTTVSIVSAWFSGYFWNGFEYSLVIGLATVLGATVDSNEGNSDRNVFFLCLALLGSWMLLEIAIEYYRQSQLFGWYGFVRLPVPGFRNPNVLARFLGLLGLGLLVIPSRFRSGSLLGIPLLILVVLSGSRGALLGLVLAGGAYLWLKTTHTMTSTRRGLLVLFVVVLILGVGVSLYPTTVAKVTTLQRVNLIQESFHLLSDYPVTGVGGWNFGLVYPGVSFDDQWQRHPHSLPFWLLTAFGYGGTVLVFGLGTALSWGRLRLRYLPLIVFLLVHELVDTMFWIPGILLLSVVLLVGGVDTPKRRGRQSRLLPVVCLLVVTAGLFVWKTDKNYKEGLKHYRAGEYDTALSHWGNDWAGFTMAHRSAALARKNKHVKAIRALDSAIRSNRHDPYYVRVKARLYERVGRRKRARRLRARYDEMDPYRMLTLRERQSGEDDGDPAGTPPSVTFLELWRNQRKPRYYLSFVEEALEAGNLDLARDQIRFLLEMPKLTRDARGRLLDYRGDVLERLNESPEKKRFRDSAEENERRLYRNQFHYFFYRRPGFDYVPNRSND